MAQAITRGVRNNNPGNVDHSASNLWVGELPVDKALESRFCRFDTAENGIRCLGKILVSYYHGHGLKTIRQILARYAPGLENDTGAYIRAVAAETGFGADQELPTVKDQRIMAALVRAIIRHENANYEYPADVLAEGIRRALA